ncbi:MAG: PhzF family phenazine biosynthesis protein [Planctomycetota bacterium]|nr:MAG: PhzF family phenazine biosynthesis protein [Planctomycetota bacterium]
MQFDLYQLDAFARAPLGGNPAAVVPLRAWLPDELLQAVAAENHLAETAFLVPADGGAGEPEYHLRWFTPAVEVELCGHATLAAAAVVFRYLAPGAARVRFRSAGGPLAVRQAGELLELDFPARPPRPSAHASAVAAALGTVPREVLEADDLMAVLADEEEVRALAPDLPAVAALPGRGLIATAPGGASGADFVSRFFAPGVGVPEDPATGSAHCALIPYWAGRLGRTELHALQLSARVGELFCRLAADGERVAIAGRVFPYLSGRIELPDPA